MRLEHLYRYPVKGLTAEALEETMLEEGRCLPWDRAFALAQGDAPFDPAAPTFVAKKHFLSLWTNPRAATLRASFTPRTGQLVLRRTDGTELAANVLSEPGRDLVAGFLTGFLGAEARGTPRFHHVPGHAFADDEQQLISIASLASLAEYEARAGAPRARLRFRANVWLGGTTPWAEFDWLGREAQLGGARLRITARIPRCRATHVNPSTGETDADVLAELNQHYGHRDFGIYAEVIEGGRIAVGDALELLDL